MKRLGCALFLFACAHASPAPQKVAFEEPAVIVAGEADPVARAKEYDRQGKYAEALSLWEKSDGIEAQFHAAWDEHELHRLDAAVTRLEKLLQRPEIKPVEKGSALLQIGVCRIEGKARAEGEMQIRQALEIFDREPAVDPSLPAQAEFWLGEAFRGGFSESALDPAAMSSDALSDALEKKAQYLLSAQGHYLRSIRQGDGEWATAAGFRIGEMYETFYDQLIHAPVPSNLTEAQRNLYEEELHKKVRNLVEKAVRIYEQTLSNAQNTGAQNAYRQKTQDALERLRKLLL
jgi:tetratricopeptide (TPR) repeat protein